MTSQNKTGSDVKPVTLPQDNAAPTPAEPSESDCELTDAEIAAIAGGSSGGGTGSAPVKGKGLVITNTISP
jgi:hypothetical protein